MECPKCKLLNPPVAQRCDCGYDFASAQMKDSFVSAKSQEQPDSLDRVVTKGAGLFVQAIGWVLFAILVAVARALFKPYPVATALMVGLVLLLGVVAIVVSANKSKPASPTK